MLVKNQKTIRVEITNKCNARCPGCERTVDGDTHPAKEGKQTYRGLLKSQKLYTMLN